MRSFLRYLRKSSGMSEREIAQRCDLARDTVRNCEHHLAKMKVETIAKLAEISNITMVKEATGSLDQCSQILNTTNLTVLSGDDSLTLPMMSIGAQGVISVAGNIVPGDLLAMVKAALDGDFVLAAKWHHKLFPLCRDMLSLATNPIPVKAAMMLLGRDTGELRLPMTALEPAELDVLRGTLERFGLMGQ